MQQIAAVLTRLQYFVTILLSSLTFKDCTDNLVQEPLNAYVAE